MRSLRDAAKNYCSFTILVVSEGGQTGEYFMAENMGEILVKVNGEERSVPEGKSVRELLEFLAIDAERVAVELNRRIVRKGEWDATPVLAGAEVEIVMFVGGG
jgi:sulfur carrier protein